MKIVKDTNNNFIFNSFTSIFSGFNLEEDFRWRYWESGNMIWGKITNHAAWRII